MREEIRNWWEQAKRDLISAGNSLNSGDYYVCAFLCQQSIEKALKAYILLKKRESPGPVHSLLKLSRIAGLPNRFYEFLKQLSPEYYISRYPDAVDDVPYKLYKENEVRGILKKSKEVLKWLNTQMKE
jgi:HEPN domain-containing protein